MNIIWHTKSRAKTKSKSISDDVFDVRSFVGLLMFSMLSKWKLAQKQLRFTTRGHRFYRCIYLCRCI